MKKWDWILKPVLWTSGILALGYFLMPIVPTLIDRITDNGFIRDKEIELKSREKTYTLLHEKFDVAS